MVHYNGHQTQHVLQYWWVLLDFQKIIITVLVWLPSPTVKPPEPLHLLHTFIFLSSNNTHVVHTTHVNLNAHPNNIKFTMSYLYLFSTCVKTVYKLC